MAETLPNINSFLAAVSRQSAINSSSDVSAYKKETVVINAGNRQYDDIIKFTNKDNVYNGTFITSAGNILDIIQNVTTYLSSDISTNISDQVSRLEITLNNTIENTANSTYARCYNNIIGASNNYTNIAIATKLSSNNSEIRNLNTRINQLSTTILNKENDIISGYLQPNLNAQFLEGSSLSDIISMAAISAQTTLAVIDCGKI